MTLQLDQPRSTEVRTADVNDIAACKVIADRQRDALGFLSSAVFSDAICRNHLLVATDTRGILGFVRFNHHVRGEETTIYDICVDPTAQRQGIGRLMVESVAISCREHKRNAIVLRCPEGLPANAFYASVGFEQLGVKQGRRRRLIVWRLSIEAGLCGL